MGRILFGTADSEGLEHSSSGLWPVSESHSATYHLGDYSNYLISSSILPGL